MDDPETDDVQVTIENESDKAYQFIDDQDRIAWFPKSQVSFKYRSPSGKATATIPLWLLKKNGWE